MATGSPIPRLQQPQTSHRPHLNLAEPRPLRRSHGRTTQLFPEIGSSLITIVTILGFAGAALLFRQNRPAFWPLAIPLAVYPPVYYLTQNLLERLRRVNFPHE